MDSRAERKIDQLMRLTSGPVALPTRQALVPDSIAASSAPRLIGTRWSPLRGDRDTDAIRFFRVLRG